MPMSKMGKSLLNTYLTVFLFYCACVEKANSACLPAAQRFDCHPEPGSSEERCLARGCCWEATKLEQPNVPACSYPDGYGGYKTISFTDAGNGFTASLERTFPSAYPRDIPELAVEGFYLTDTILRIKITDPSSARYEVPYPKIPTFDANGVSPEYNVQFNQSATGFRVTRKDGTDIFNSLNVGAFTYADQFLEISTLLASSVRLYGIGEHRTPNVSLEGGWKRLTLFNRDIPPAENANLYGTHPFYLATDSSGQFYGVFLHNSNAMDVLVTPRPALTFRTIGGILDFYFFMGPTPADVIKQYTSVVGRTLLPPFWSLGFHLCRYGYGSLNNTREVWQRNRATGILYDTQWNDIDYMDNNNIFTVNNGTFAGLSDFVEELHSAGMHYIVIIDPGVSGGEPPGTYPPYDLGIETDILVKNRSGSVLFGRVWNTQSTAWVDFTHPHVQEYWNELVMKFHENVGIDGIWIDMNEPSNLNAEGSLDGCPDDVLENPPYTPGVVGDRLLAFTLCMTAQHAAGSHYNVHNIYGIAEAHVTNLALRNIGKRPFVISRASYSGSGKYTGHWSGDNAATWEDLAKSVQEVLTFNMFGVSLIGADICGFRDDTNQELCNRWYQLGAFYTFARNHNGASKDQDPAVFDEETQKSISAAVALRYKFLPYLYTLFYLSHTTGSTVARPLFFDFPQDTSAYSEENAFLWGSELLIVPVVAEGATTVEAYIPKGRWYHLHTGAVIETNGEKLLLDAPTSYIPVFAKGGSMFYQISPTQPLSANEELPMNLAVYADADGKATTLLYWDDWDNIDPVESDLYGIVRSELHANKTITHRVDHWTVLSLGGAVPEVESISVFGVDVSTLTRLVLNDKEIKFEKINGTTVADQGFQAFGFEAVPINRDFTLQWN